MIGAFGPDGTLRAGWPVSVPVAVGESVQLLPVPAGGLYVCSWTDGASETRLLGSDGALRASWPVAVGGSAVVGADGSLYGLLFDANGLASHIEVLGADGSRATGTAADWQAMDVGTKNERA